MTTCEVAALYCDDFDEVWNNQLWYKIPFSSIPLSVSFYWILTLHSIILSSFCTIALVFAYVVLMSAMKAWCNFLLITWMNKCNVWHMIHYSCLGPKWSPHCFPWQRWNMSSNDKIRTIERCYTRTKWRGWGNCCFCESWLNQGHDGKICYLMIQDDKWWFNFLCGMVWCDVITYVMI